MKFEDGFFEKEERAGFVVPELMKHAWAAQIELLEEIRKICIHHNIAFFAEYGTMLGAVRHNGYIPWDDDLDIGMLRKDLKKFLEVAPKELPKECRVLNMHIEPDYRDVMTRVVNSSHVSLEANHMKKYHGCPFVVGIDIFPFDYVPRDDRELTMVMTILKALGEILKIVWGEVDAEVKLEAAKQVEPLCGFELDWTRPVDNQILNLYENIMSMYTEEESDKIGIFTSMVGGMNKEYCFDREWFATTIEMPFENTTVPVPVGYDNILRMRYGNYMEPKIFFAHDYPFYNGQKDEIKRYIDSNPEYADMWKRYLE